MTRLSAIPANAIAVWCSCGHSAVIEASEILARWGDMTVKEAVGRMRCWECGLRGEIEHMRIIYAGASDKAMAAGAGQYPGKPEPEA